MIAAGRAFAAESAWDADAVCAVGAELPETSLPVLLLDFVTMAAVLILKP